MPDITNQNDNKFAEVTLVPANREHVEHALCRVRVLAVATVNDIDVWRDVTRDEVCRTRLTMADNKHIALQ